MKLNIVNTLRNQYFAYRYGAKGKGKQIVRRSRKAALEAWPLVQPYDGNGLKLSHRVVHAPHTRCRVEYPSGNFTPMATEYYAQRATKGGLVVMEALAVSPWGRVSPRAPGIWSKEQEESLKELADVGKETGCLFYPQLTHCGRSAQMPTATEVEQMNMPPKGGVENLHLTPSGVAWPAAAPEGFSGSNFAPMPPQRTHTMAVADIKASVDEFHSAAVRLKRAGFPGVQILMSGSGLIHTFLHHATNRRDDKYGGDAAKRARYALEVVDAVSDVFGAKNVGANFHFAYGSCGLTDTLKHERSTYRILFNEFESRGVGHIMYWPMWEIGTAPGNAEFSDFYGERNVFLRQLREQYSGLLIRTGFGKNVAKAAEMVGHEDIDAAGFASLYQCVPDLQPRIKHGAEFTANFDHYNAVFSTLDFNRMAAATEEEDALNYIDWLPAELPDEIEADPMEPIQL